MLISRLSGWGYAKKEIIAPQLIGISSFVISASSISVDVPSEYAQNDLLVLFLDGTTSYPATPSGWESIGTSRNTSQTNGARLRICYKIAGASESGVTVADSGNSTCGIMACFRGINSTSPINASAAAADNTLTKGTLTLPGLTTTVDKCLVVNGIGFADYSSSNDSDSYSDWTNSSLESITEGFDYYKTQVPLGGLAFAYGEKVVAGEVNATTVTADSINNIAGAVTFAIAPAD